MAVVSCIEVADGAGMSGKYGESFRFTRKFKIRVDSPTTPKPLIVNANGVGWGDPHPDNADCRAMEFDLQPADPVGMIWTNTVTYYVPPKDKVRKAGSLAPEDYWEATGGTDTVPCFLDINGDAIANSAGDALEGIERERSEFSWSLVKFYVDDSWQQDARDVSNTVNSASWAGGDAKTWKCEFKSAKVRELQGDGDEPETLRIVETHWEFRYDANTWRSMPWDIGFMEVYVESGDTVKRTILGGDGKPVKQPAALTPTGEAAQDGDPPGVANNGAGFDIYESRDFGTIFGTPSILG
jgi:hypothetical protein